MRWCAPILCLEHCWGRGSMHCLTTGFRKIIIQKMEYIRMLNKIKKLYSGRDRWFDSYHSGLTDH